jgi:hypothetical protein
LASEHVDDFVVSEPSRYSEPISLADARSEMDVLDHRFVYFIALEDQHGKALCLRHDGDYGLVELDPPLPAPCQPTFLRALDHSAPGDLLAEEVTFSSPFADYHGRADVIHLLALVAHVLQTPSVTLFLRPYRVLRAALDAMGRLLADAPLPSAR